MLVIEGELKKPSVALLEGGDFRLELVRENLEATESASEEVLLPLRLNKPMMAWIKVEVRVESEALP